MATNVLLLVVSLGVLTLGAELLVRGSSHLAARMGVSSFFIGLTIVGLGTSAPELATGVTAAFKGQTDINAGNVIGSNIFNIAVVLGLSALIAPVPVKTHLVRSEAWVVIAVAFVPFLTLLTSQTLTWPVGVLMVAALLAYITRGYFLGRKETLAPGVSTPILSPDAPKSAPRPASIPLNTAFVLGGIALLWIASGWLVESAVMLAQALGVSELVIALTIVAAGTSMPELVTSLLSALRKESDIAVGNVLGSNIFNILGILGLTSTLKEQTLSPQVLALDTPVMIAASLALLPIMLSGSRISRAEGSLLLVGYCLYVSVLLAFAPGWFA